MEQMDPNYKFVKKLGSGVEGEVSLYQFKDEPVVIKSFFAKAFEIKSTTLHEMDALSQLKNCIYINHLIDVKITPKLNVNIVMDYHTSDLEVFFLPLSKNERLQHFDQLKHSMFNALTNLYYYGIIHNDIKPPNILVDYPNLRFVLADFGLSIQLPCDPDHRNIKKAIRGSPVYQAPELLAGDNKYTTNVDVWSLGITFLDYLLRTTDNDYSLTCTEECHNLEDVLDHIKTLLVNNHIDLTGYWFPADIKILLHQMLQFDKQLRPNIIDLVTEPISEKVEMIERGEPKSTIPLSVYYKNIYQIIDLSFATNLKLTTCYFAIDLIERYCHTYEITLVNHLMTYSIAILVLIASFYENATFDLEALANEFDYFTYANLIQAIKLVLSRFHFRLTTCETDEIFYTLYNKYDYDQFENVYKQLEKDQQYSGNVFNFEWIEYYRTVHS